MYFLPKQYHQVGGLNLKALTGTATGSLGDLATGSSRAAKQASNLADAIPTGSFDDLIQTGIKQSDDVADLASGAARQIGDVGGITKNIDNLADVSGDITGTLKKIDVGDITADVSKSLDDATDIAGDIVKKGDLSKNIDDIAETAGDNIDDLAKKIDDSADDIGEAIGKETATSAKQKLAKFIKNNPKKLIGGVASAAIGGIALGIYLSINETEFIITKMEKKDKENEKSGDTELILSYKLEDEDTEYFQFKTYDTIKIIENDAIPKIPTRIYNITEVDNDNRKVTISIPEDLMPTTLGETGKFLYQTDFANSLRRTAEDIIGGATDAAGGAAKGALEGFTNSIADLLGVEPGTLKLIFFGLVAFIVLLVIGGIAMKFM